MVSYLFFMRIQKWGPANFVPIVAQKKTQQKLSTFVQYLCGSEL